MAGLEAARKEFIVVAEVVVLGFRQKPPPLISVEIAPADLSFFEGEIERLRLVCSHRHAASYSIFISDGCRADFIISRRYVLDPITSLAVRQHIESHRGFHVPDFHKGCAVRRTGGVLDRAG